jgi:hypothetical protein
MLTGRMMRKRAERAAVVGASGLPEFGQFFCSFHFNAQADSGSLVREHPID